MIYQNIHKIFKPVQASLFTRTKFAVEVYQTNSLKAFPVFKGCYSELNANFKKNNVMQPIGMRSMNNYLRVKQCKFA